MLDCVQYTITEAADTSLGRLFAPCKGAYSDNTLRGYATDLKFFIGWCEKQDRCWLPAESATIALFLENQLDTCKIATLKRRLAAINFAHRLTDRPSPTASSAVQLALRRAARAKRRRPDQAHGLTAPILKQIVDSCPQTLAGLRDGALVSVGYDTLCRSAELAAIRVEHLRFGDDGETIVLIPRSKGDVAGDGRIAYLSPQTADRLNRWLDAANIDDGPVFRSLHLARISEAPLDTSSIRRLVKRAANRAGVSKVVASRLSGHSMRVGAAQDMLVAGFDALAIMQAGGWKSPNVLLRYVENAATKKLHERRWQAVWEA